MTLSKMSLVDKIVHLLEDREDVELLIGTDEEIWGTQLRRMWTSETKNPAGFNPVTSEQFRYYAQTFVVLEPRFVKKTGEMVREQREFAAKWGRIGVTVIWAQEIDNVIDHLGPVPKNIGEFIGRKER